MKERNSKICELYRQGVTKQQLCEQFGISKRTLSRVLSAKGLTRGKRLSLSTEAKNDVISAYLEGLPVYKLAEKYDTSEYQIEKCLEEVNVSKRGLGESQAVSKQAELDQRYDEILSLLLDGNLTLKEVAQKLGIHWTSLRDFRRRHGLDVDRRSLEGYRPKRRERQTARKNVEIIKPISPLDEDNMRLYLKTFSENKGYYGTLKELAAYADIPYTTFQQAVQRYDLGEYVTYRISSFESSFENFLKTLDVEYIRNYRGENGLEIDFYIPSKKCGFEMNPSSIHVTVGQNYHQDKKLSYLDLGVVVYHIYGYEWILKRFLIEVFVKSKLGIYDKRIGARECDVREVSYKDASLFLEQYHLMGTGIRGSEYLGLYYQNMLVSLLVMGNSRFNAEYDWEILRFVSKSGWQVIGGFGKLFNAFLKSQPSDVSIMTYVDFDKSSKVPVYEKVGFKYERLTKPDYIWVKVTDQSYVTRYQSQKKKLIEKGYSENLTEKEIMESLYYRQMWLSGNLVYTYES